MADSFLADKLVAMGSSIRGVCTDGEITLGILKLQRSNWSRASHRDKIWARWL